MLRVLTPVNLVLSDFPATIHLYCLFLRIPVLKIIIKRATLPARFILIVLVVVVVLVDGIYLTLVFLFAVVIILRLILNGLVVLHTLVLVALNVIIVILIYNILSLTACVQI